MDYINECSLATQYHDAKSERKCLTTSLRIKHNSVNHDGAEPPSRTRSMSGSSRVATATLEFKETKIPQLVKSNSTMVTEYHIARQKYATLKSVRGGISTDTSQKRSTPRSSGAGMKPKLKSFNGAQQRGKSPRLSRGKRSNTRATTSMMEKFEADHPRHTTKSGYELFGINRPDDNIQEHGLADGIHLHLIESIKLCGLRKARENSINEMITTLCTHLSEREGKVQRWVQFADSTVVTAAERLSESSLENDAMRTVMETQRKNTKSVQLRALATRHEVLELNNEMKAISQFVKQMIEEFNETIRDIEASVIRGCKYHIDSVKSQSKLEVKKVLDSQEVKFNEEKLRLESIISSLQSANKTERDKFEALNNQFNAASIAANEAKQREKMILQEFDLERQSLNNKLSKLGEANARLEDLLKEEKANKLRKLDEMEEQMKNKLEEIEVKVKCSMESLTKSKDREIEEARARAIEAEQVLSDLKAAVFPVVSCAEESEKK